MDSQQKPLLILEGLIYRGHRYIRNRGINRNDDGYNHLFNDVYEPHVSSNSESQE